MMHSSIGFHTISLSMPLGKDNIQKLIKDFKTYSATTGRIKVFPVDGKNKDIEIQFQGDSDIKIVTVPQKNLKIVYNTGHDEGIEWLLRCNSWNRDFKPYLVEVKINPKILSGISDYITAATYEDMTTAIANFNCESRKISSLLGDFCCYRISRVDYSVNLYIPEVAPSCTSEQIMNLIRRSDIPPYYKEWTEYDSIAHRRKSKPESFYLINPCVNINCYVKATEFQKRSQKRESMGRTSIPQSIMDRAQGVIRFEVQCKYRKIYDLRIKAKKYGYYYYNEYEYLLSNEVCCDIINHYWNATIGGAPWHSLQSAIAIIKSKNFNSQKENRLIDTLKWINQRRSVSSSREKYTGTPDSFSRTLRDLSRLNINPVTIPKDWGIQCIWNPLRNALPSMRPGLL